jgi:fibronectin-binding autotransporter adhesin
MNGAGTQTFNGNGRTFYQVTLGNASATSLVVTGANTYTNLIFGGSAAVQRTVTFSANQTVTGTLNFGGASPTTNPHNRRTLIKSDTFGTQRTISIAAASNVQTLDFQDIAITGAASPISGSSLADRLGNSGITFTAAKTVYWVGGTGNWSSNAGTRWAASSGGGAAVTNFPLAQDTAVIDDSSGTGTLTVDVVDVPNAVGTLDMSARTAASFIFSAGSNNFYVFADLKLKSGVGFQGGPVNLETRSSASITSNGASGTAGIVINALGGTVSLVDAFSSTSSSGFVLTRGTLDLNGNTLTCGSGCNFVTSGSQSRTLALGSSNLVCANSGASAFSASGSNFTVTGTGKIRMTSASAKTFAGGGYTYPELENAGAGSLTISGSNTFTTISNSVQPTTFNFTSGTTQTVTNFNVSGTSGNLVTITATSTGAATLSKASGTVSVSFCSITKSTATGGATWRALLADGNVDAGSNTGWNFGSRYSGLFFGSNF